jgi:uncharacterized protein
MKEFSPTVQELQDKGLVFYEVVAGSQSHGTNTPKSDIDTRGYYYVPKKYRNSLWGAANQSQDPVTDTEFYSLKRAFELLIKANPNQIELLWTPKDCIRGFNKPIMDELMDNRDLFITKAAYESHFQYARAQIGKATGRNKLVNNPKPKKAPTRRDFCWYIDLQELGRVQEHIVEARKAGAKEYNPPARMPFRPHKAGDLSIFNCAKLEHVENAYRLYWHGGDAKGVFRGPNEQLVCESIPKEDEWSHLFGLLIYNEQDYKRAYKDWKNYWDWMKNRNDARWEHQEKGTLSFDSKNMSHCVRLLMSSRNILAEGCPIVRFEGDQLKLLKDIKAGEVEYPEIMETVEKLQVEIDVLLDKTSIPDVADFDKLNRLYVHLNTVAEKELV